MASPEEEAMHRTKRVRGLRDFKTVGVVLAALVTTSVAAVAQFVVPKDPNQPQAYLVHKDFSDCQNSDVPNADSPSVAGNVWVTRLSDGNTSVKVAVTAKPSTTYHFFLKCVRHLGDIPTDSEGVGNASFSFATSSVGNVYAFDMYPEGAPAGNKYQSAQVKFQ
jgi:hypothetical protein